MATRNTLGAAGTASSHEEEQDLEQEEDPMRPFYALMETGKSCPRSHSPTANRPR